MIQKPVLLSSFRDDNNNSSLCLNYFSKKTVSTEYQATVYTHSRSACNVLDASSRRNCTMDSLWRKVSFELSGHGAVRLLSWDSIRLDPDWLSSEGGALELRVDVAEGVWNSSTACLGTEDCRTYSSTSPRIEMTICIVLVFWLLLQHSSRLSFLKAFYT